MVQLDRGSALLRASEEALGRMLPPGWLATMEPSRSSGDLGVDSCLDLTAPSGERTRACVEVRARAEPADVVRLVPWLQRCDPAILVAPAIGPRARSILTGAGVSWMEPDGDCRISIASLFIERLGRSTKRRAAEEPGTRYVANLFSGAALRIVRWLLIEPGRSWTLAEMAGRTDLSLGFVSRTFKTLGREAYLERSRGANRLGDRTALLDAWAATPVAMAPAAERVATVGSTEGILRAIGGLESPERYAVTAEAAADRLAPLARFSRVELYVEDVPAWDARLGLTPVPRGGNVVLLTPADAGVFDGALARDGIVLVCRPQLYVDLVRRGGVAAEAAAFLRERGELWPR